MMNKQQAYNSFWNRFGVLAFEEHSVPDDKVIDELIKAGKAPSKYPYIAYQVIIDDLGHPVFPTASIYDKSSSWETIDLLVNRISDQLKATEVIPLENGRMFIAKGAPFAQHWEENADESIRRTNINLQVEFLTA